MDSKLCHTEPRYDADNIGNIGTVRGPAKVTKKKIPRELRHSSSSVRRVRGKESGLMSRSHILIVPTGTPPHGACYTAVEKVKSHNSLSPLTKPKCKRLHILGVSLRVPYECLNWVFGDDLRRLPLYFHLDISCYLLIMLAPQHPGEDLCHNYLKMIR